MNVPESLQKTLFVSLPKTVPSGATVFVEYDDQAVVTDLLERNDIVVTLSFIGGSPSTRSTPTNGFMGRTSNTTNNTVTDRRGEVLSAVLAIDVNAKQADDSTKKAASLVAEYLLALEKWYLTTAKRTVQITGKSNVSNLTELEDGAERRHVDINFEYRLSVLDTVESIETVSKPELEVR